jgi:RNA polymerase sigma factor (sigma-70 family)
MTLDTSVSYLLRRITFGPRPERLEEQVQVARASEGDRGAIGLLVASNFAYVVHVAKEFRGRGLPFEDVIAEGCVGLLKAVHRYRATNGTRFMTYASFWVRKEILAAIAHQPHEIHVPRYARAHGSIPPSVLRIDAPTREDGNLSLADCLRHPDPLPAEQIIEKAGTRRLRRHVLRLAPRDRAVIMWRYGLDGEPEQTLKEIALRLGISRERVRQIEVSALAGLRQALADRRPSRRRSPGLDRLRFRASASANG